jgi:hypothetical protein
MKTDEKVLVIREISVFKFLFLECWIGINEQRDGKILERKCYWCEQKNKYQSQINNITI